uniref:Uncharacterized protein n=1 Tax=Trichuris muris TaxID=70415 RepID=A0A5S6R3L5_TRIMR
MESLDEKARNGSGVNEDDHDRRTRPYRGTRGSRRRPQPATVSQSQEPSLVDATFKGRRKKPDTSHLL